MHECTERFNGNMINMNVLNERLYRSQRQHLIKMNVLNASTATPDQHECTERKTISLSTATSDQNECTERFNGNMINQLKDYIDRCITCHFIRNKLPAFSLDVSSEPVLNGSS